MRHRTVIVAGSRFEARAYAATHRITYWVYPRSMADFPPPREGHIILTTTWGLHPLASLAAGYFTSSLPPDPNTRYALRNRVVRP